MKTAVIKFATKQVTDRFGVSVTNLFLLPTESRHISKNCNKFWKNEPLTKVTMTNYGARKVSDIFSVTLSTSQYHVTVQR